MKNVVIYTDGACSGNPGPGGWGAVLLYNDFRREMSGFDPATTNNRMEITAVLEALGALREPCTADVYTDSTYVANTFSKGWIRNWARNGWLTSKKTPVENRDLWEKMLDLTQTHTVRFHVVRGHANNVENNRCDKLATDAIKNNRK